MTNKYETRAELFEDEKQMGAIFGSYIIYGFVSFIVIFLICWLGFDSFWWGLLFGLGALFFFLFRTLSLSMARNEYLEYIEKNAEEGAKAMGVEKEKMEEIMRSSTKVIEKAINDSDKT